jgi:hypothetical protein
MKRAKKKDENKVDYGTISLPIPLIEKIKKRIEGTGMNSVSAYVAFVLREVLSANSKELFDKKEMKNLQIKLKSLGY